MGDRGAYGGRPDVRIGHGVDRVGAHGEGGEPCRVGEFWSTELVGFGGSTFTYAERGCDVASGLFDAGRGYGQDQGRRVEDTLRGWGVIHVWTVSAGGGCSVSSGWVTVCVDGWVGLPVLVGAGLC